MNKFAYDLPKDLYKGMRVRPTMDMIANSIEHDPYRIKYPDREASFYLNSPQFLSLLQDTNVGLAEQSKRQAKQQLAEAQIMAEGRGGIVDRATRGLPFGDSMSGDDSNATTPRTREERAIALVERLREEKRRKRLEQENAEYLRKQQEALDKAKEEQQRRAQELASASASSSTAHPVAAAAAAAAAPPYIFSMGSPASMAAASAASAAAAMSPTSIDDIGMSSGEQAKRKNEKGLSPTAKAKSDPSSSSKPPQAGTGEKEEEGSPKAVGGVKKTISKSHQQLRDRLTDELKYLTVDIIISKLKNDYRVDKAAKQGSDKATAVNKSNFTKPELIEVYVEVSSKAGRLIKDRDTLEEERERRGAESLAAARRERSQQVSERTRARIKGSSARRSSTRQPRGRAAVGATGGTD
jgi:hypothetical protein